MNHITYLLDRHDCVTVPGFGTFLVHHAPARIDYFSKTILPPSRRVSFNSEADFDDSLLVSSYARKNSLNYSDALEMMKGEVSMFKEMLEAGGKGILPGVGILSMTVEKGLVFEGDDTCLSLAGLKCIAIEPQAIPEITENKIATVEAVQVSKFSSLLHRSMKYAAMVVVFISMAIVFSTPVPVNSSEEIVKANLCPFETTGNNEEIMPELLISMPSQAEDPAEITESFSDAENTLEVSSSATNAKITLVKSADELCAGDYILVIGSLATESQALQFIKDTGNDAMGVVEINGRFRVYGAVSSSTSALMKSELLSKYPDAWPCRISENGH